MEHIHTAALLGLTHIEGLVRHVPEGQEAGQEEGATACASDQVGRIQQDCDDGSDGRTDSEAEIGGHGGSSDGLSLQDISPEELWDALVTAIEEGEAHGSGGLDLNRGEQPSNLSVAGLGKMNQRLPKPMLRLTVGFVLEITQSRLAAVTDRRDLRQAQPLALDGGNDIRPIHAPRISETR